MNEIGVETIWISPVYKSPAHLKIKGSQGRLQNPAVVSEDNHSEGTALSSRLLTNLNANSVLIKDAMMREEKLPVVQQEIAASPQFRARGLRESCMKYMQDPNSQQSSMLDFLRSILLCHDVTKVTD